MPVRGPVQLLLLFFRLLQAGAARAFRAGLIPALLIAVIGVAGLAVIAGKTALDMLTDSAWKRALAQGFGDPFPWSGDPASSSAKIKRLGLSAVALDEIADDSKLALEPALFDSKQGRGPYIVSANGRQISLLGHVAVGERIAITTPGGQTLTYKVTGARIVDAADARHITQVLGPTLTLVTRWPPEAVADGKFCLIIEAVAVEPSAPQQSDAQKL